MPRVRIQSIQGLERFAASEQLRIDWLAPHPDWLHSLVNRSLGRFLGVSEEHWSVYPEESAAPEPGEVLEALDQAGFDLWATSNGPWTRLFLTRRVPADPRWSGSFCPWCPSAGPISA